jgi:hypothetical protein
MVLAVIPLESVLLTTALGKAGFKLMTSSIVNSPLGQLIVSLIGNKLWNIPVVQTTKSRTRLLVECIKRSLLQTNPQSLQLRHKLRVNGIVLGEMLMV